jgi:hypothetical protein
VSGFEPTLVIVPTELDFNDVEVGDTDTLCAVVHNPSCRALMLGSVALVSGPGAFSIARNLRDLTLFGGEYDTLCISFSPTATGPFDDIVELAVSPTLKFPVRVTGNGVRSEVEAPASIEFGAVQLGAGRDEVVLVTNEGLVPVTLNSPPTITGAHASDFTIVGLRLPATISRGLPLPIRVRFAPQALGDRTASLRVENSSQTDPVVSLHGVGVADNVVVTPDSIEMGDVYVGSARTSYEVIHVVNGNDYIVRLDSLVVTGSDSSSFGLGGFVVAPIAARDSLLLDVRFSPNAARDFYARAEGKMSTGMRFTIYLHGRGIIPEPTRDRTAWVDSAAASVGDRFTLHARITPGYQTIDSVDTVVAHLRIDPSALYPHSVSSRPGRRVTHRYAADGALQVTVEGIDSVIAGTDLFELELEGLYTGRPQNPVMLDSMVVLPYRGAVTARNGMVALSGCDIAAGGLARITRTHVHGERLDVMVADASQNTMLRLVGPDGSVIRETLLDVGDAHVAFDLTGVPSGAVFVELRSGIHRTVHPVLVVR